MGRWLNVLSPRFEIPRLSIFAHLLILIKPVELFSWCQVEFRDFGGANFGNKTLLTVYRLLVEFSALQDNEFSHCRGLQRQKLSLSSRIAVVCDRRWLTIPVALHQQLGNHSQVRARQAKCCVQTILAQLLNYSAI